MADPDSLIARAYETIVGWLARGHETRTQPLAQFVRDPRTPVVYDANFIADVRARTPDEIESVLAAADSMYRELAHRHFLWDPEMPIEFEARLQLDGYAGDDELILVLEGPLANRGPRLELRPVESDADWRVMYELCRLDHEEEAEKGFHRAWEAEVTQQLVASKRVKAPDVRYYLARADGVDCAFFSAWPGENGVGQIEDLFTRAEFRGPDRGLRRRRARARRGSDPDRRAHERHAQTHVRRARLPTALHQAVVRQNHVLAGAGPRTAAGPGTTRRSAPPRAPLAD
jgi:hypothetical protein